jgi:hypothetical protein
MPLIKLRHNDVEIKVDYLGKPKVEITSTTIVYAGFIVYKSVYVIFH